MDAMPFTFDDSHECTVLLVDENPINIHVLHQSLKGLGRHLFALSGIEALEIIKKQVIHLILMDINMPGLSGFDACREIRRIWPDIPVVFVTSHQDLNAEVEALDAGGIDFIHKPINPPALRARIRAHLTMKRQSDLLRNLIRLDPLTEVANRRALDERLSTGWRSCQEMTQNIALFMIDVDFFKRYNDHYGHPAGDRCLRVVAQAMLKVIGSRGFLARYGGEEFAVLLLNVSQEESLEVGGSILDAIRSLEEPHEKSTVSPHVTVSIGIAVINPAATATKDRGEDERGVSTESELIQRADEALYQAKLLGRNRLALANEVI
jgi:diguanylate cyclase (GGDEF)-like protein